MSNKEPEINYKKGYVSTYRSLLDHWVGEDKPYNYLAAWVYMLLKANHKENKFLFNNSLLCVERGSFVTSELKLMEDFGWSKSRTRHFLLLLEKDEMIVKKADNKKTTITILNYDTYQDLETIKELKKDFKRTTERLQRDTNNNELIMINNGNNGNAPNLETVIEYFLSLGYPKEEAEKFWSTYTSQGWETKTGAIIKNWQAKVMGWMNNSKQFNNSSMKTKEEKPFYETDPDAWKKKK